MSKKDKLNTEPYKGVRDFYPEDMFDLKYIFGKMREVAESFGYREYGASPLEYYEIYNAKSGEEIAKQQTYAFEDKGGRKVALRPEMTPTVSRMVAKRSRELTFPLRWYSIVNLFRYEKPQKGRLREHFQLNMDLFGGIEKEANREMIHIVHSLMNSFGAKNEDFIIKVNYKEITDKIFEKIGIPEDAKKSLSKLLDKKDKMTSRDLSSSMIDKVGEEKSKKLLEVMSKPQKIIEFLGKDDPSVIELISEIEYFSSMEMKNVFFEPTLVRGFDYYTGFVFEVFDTNKENQRSIFGGGRYDALISLFGDREIPAVGFGMGDVTFSEFLKRRELLPEYDSETELYICRADRYPFEKSEQIAGDFRKKGINTEVDISGKKLGEQIKKAVKKKIPFALILEDDENLYTLKDLRGEKERKLSLDECLKVIKE